VDLLVYFNVESGKYRMIQVHLNNINLVTNFISVFECYLATGALADIMNPMKLSLTYSPQAFMKAL